MKKALVVIDMQNDFIDGSLGTPEAQAIVLSVSERVKAAVQDGEKLIFTQDTHPKNYLQTAEGKKLPVEHCIKPSHGWALTSSLIPYAKDAVVLEKPTFGATGLPQQVAGFDEITVIGLYRRRHGKCDDGKQQGCPPLFLYINHVSHLNFMFCVLDYLAANIVISL